jgi:hypothetical protein
MAQLTDDEFERKYARAFADNTYQDIVEKTFRDLTLDIRESYVNRKSLNVRIVKGATYPIPYTDSVGQIPPAYRILGMLALARVGTTAADAATQLAPPGPVTLQLVANSSGTVNALIDEQPDTKATVKAVWVLASGTQQQVIDSFPALVIQNPDGSPHPYKAGDKFKYLFPSGEARLFEVRNYLNMASNPLPTGLESDTYYRPFAPFVATTAGPGTPATPQQAVITALAASSFDVEVAPGMPVATSRYQLRAIAKPSGGGGTTTPPTQPQPPAPSGFTVDSERLASFTPDAGTVASDYEYQIEE